MSVVTVVPSTEVAHTRSRTACVAGVRTRGDQMIRRGFLRPLEHLLLHSPLMAWAPFASNVRQFRIRSLMRTEWGQLFRKY